MPVAQKPTILPDVIDALVTMAKEWPTLGNSVEDGTTVMVYDGPETIRSTSRRTLYVGIDDPDTDNAPIAAEVEQQYVGLGSPREEEGNVFLTAEAWSGSTNVREIRNAAFGIVAEVAKMVRADATLRGTVQPGWAQVGRFQLRQNNVDTGAVARVTFQVIYKGRI